MLKSKWIGLMRHGLLMVACVLLLGSNVPLAAAEEPDMPENDVLAVIKLPPLKVLSDKLMGVARKVQPGPQTEMMPMLVLGMFGYPNFDGVSATEGVTIFVFNSAEGMGANPFVIMGKIDKGSQTRTAIMQANWSLEFREGYAFISNTAENFQAIQNTSALIRLAQEKPDFDIEFNLPLGKERVETWLETLSALTENTPPSMNNPLSQMLTPELIKNYTQFIGELGKNLLDMKLGFDINSTDLAYGMIASAQPGTAESDLFSMPATKQKSVSQFLKNGGAVAFEGSMHGPTLVAYAQELDKRAQAIFGDKENFMTQAIKLFIEYAAKSDGGYAGAYSFWGDKIVARTIYHTAMTEDEFMQFMGKSVNETMNSLQKEFGMDDMGVKMDFDFEANVGKHAGVKIHRFSSRIAQPDFAAPLDPATNEPPMKEVNTDYLYAIVKGLMLTTTSQKEMHALIDVVKKGEPLDGSIETLFAGKEAVFARFAIDLYKYSKISIDAAGAQLNSSVLNAVMESLENSQLAPALGEVSFEDARMRLYASFPVDSIAQIAAAFKAAQQAQAEAEINQGSSGQQPAGN